MGRRPDWVILNTIAVADRHSNSSTASDITRNGNTIEVSFSLRYPPHPSILFVHSSDMNRALPPSIVFTVDDFLLLSVNMGSGPSSLSPNDCDYFVYRAHATCPSLKLLRRPHPYFNGFHAGLLPRPDGHYTVAALIPTGTFNEYKLHLFHSESAIQGWRSFTVFVEAPQRGFPVKIPAESSRLHRHYTSKVITVGGKYGTMGWVDLWRGILFCDVLHPRPSLRGVPLPLPSKELSYNHHGRRFTFGPAGQRRGISFIRGDKGHGYLKLVHLEIRDVYLACNDDETGVASFRVDNWVLTTWSNTRMTDSYDDWHQDNMIQGSDIIIDDPAISHVLDSSGLLPKQLGLHNLSMSQPALSLNGEEEVVYLVARKKYRHVGAWIVAVDVKNGKVQAVERFGDQSHLDSDVIYYPSMISKYMDPATTPGCRVDGDKQSGAEDCEDDQEMDAVVQGRSKGAVGGLRKVPGEQSKLTASAPVDVADEQLIIRVGSIGCSAFGHGFHKFG